MSSTRPKSPRQFHLRSLLLGITWLGLILAICVQHQHTATRYRESLERQRAARIPPAPRFAGQSLPPARLPAPHAKR